MSQPARRRRLPIVGLLAGTALVIGFVATAFSLPIDDFWLTLASGRAILGGAPIDRALDFAWIPTIDDALNPQWGAQVLLALPGSTGGALAINSALIAIGLLVTVARTTARATGGAVAFALLLVIAAIAPHLLARAQSFSIALVPIALLLLERFGQRPWLPLAYGILMVVWANLHGAFVIGQVAAGAMLIGAVAARRQPGSIGIALATFAVSMLAPLANPVGLALVEYAYAQPGLDLIRSISEEWQPSFPWIPLTWLFWLQAAIVVVFRIRRASLVPPGDLLLTAALLVLAMSSIRHIPWFCLATAPMLAGDLAGLRRLRLGDLPAWASGASGRRTLAAAALVAVAVQPLRPLLPQSLGRVTPDSPVGLVDVLEMQLTDGSARVLNEQVWGGYLVYRLGGRVETAMDGRIEIRDRDTWASYFALMRGDGDPAGELAAEGVRWAMLGIDRTELVDALMTAGWQAVAQDDQGTLLAAPD